jgi:hypothetical protein
MCMCVRVHITSCRDGRGAHQSRGVAMVRRRGGVTFFTSVLCSIVVRHMGRIPMTHKRAQIFVGQTVLSRPEYLFSSPSCPPPPSRPLGMLIHSSSSPSRTVPRTNPTSPGTTRWWAKEGVPSSIPTGKPKQVHHFCSYSARAHHRLLCIHTHIHAYMHTYTYTYTCLQTGTSFLFIQCTCTSPHTLHTYIHTYIHAYMHTCILHTYMHAIHTYIHT